MEAVLLLASINARDPNRRYKVVLAEPQAGPNWSGDPLDEQTRRVVTDLGAEIRPFEPKYFGDSYPYGNKIEALQVVRSDGPFVFLDTDTLILSPLGDVPFDFSRPTGSLKRTASWPKISPQSPDIATIWRSLYDRFDLDFETAQDRRFDAGDWRRYPYFNAGFWFYHDANAFQDRFLEIALSIRNDPPPELSGQSLDPWLDQVALPLVIHSLDGGLDTLPAGLIDGSVTCHWRMLPLLYAQQPDDVVRLLTEISAPNPIKNILRKHEAAHRMIYRGEGDRLRAVYHGTHFETEADLRKSLKKAGHWVR